MTLSLNIALRYLRSKKSHAAVNIISAVSVAAVAVATAAIVVVLSVFNGFSDLALSHFSVLDPDLRVTPVSGKVFAAADSIAAKVASTDGVAVALPSLTDRGLLVADGSQLGVVFKGVNMDAYPGMVEYGEAVQAGARLNSDYLVGEEVFADMAVGVAMRMDLIPGVTRSELYVPRRVGRINPANPAGSFFSTPLVLQNVLAINQPEFDSDHIIVPLSTARGLLSYDDGEASAIEVKLASGASATKTKKELQRLLGDEFRVETQMEQHRESYRMIEIEKWVTFSMLVFILVIAAFNIISTMSLMVIEKRDNMATLRCLGATRRAIRHVFMWMGAAISLVGGIAGVALGALLAAVQQTTGVIKLSGDPSQLAVRVYPVRVAPTDIAAVLGLVAVLSLVVALVSLVFTYRRVNPVDK